MGPTGIDSQLTTPNNQAVLDGKTLITYQTTNGDSYIDAEGNLVLDGVAVEFAEVAMAA